MSEKSTGMSEADQPLDVETERDRVHEMDESENAYSHRQSRLPIGNHYLLIAVGVLIALGAVAYGFWPNKREATSPGPSVVQASAAPSDVVLADEKQAKEFGVEAVGRRMIDLDRETTGKIGFNEEKQTAVFTPYGGRAVEVLVNKGDSVRAGQPLVVLESPELVSAENDLSAAQSEVDKSKISLNIAQAAAERARRLNAQEAIAAKDLQQSEADLVRAQEEQRRSLAALAVVENRLALFGKSAEEIAKLNGQVDNRVVIRAPISGTVVDRKIGPGQFIKPDLPDPMFLIADLSTLWAQADIFENDLNGVRTGAPVEIRVPSYPDRVFRAQISFINQTVDPLTRTVHVRCVVANPGAMLKPDMFAKIKIDSSVPREVSVAPCTAVISQNNQSFVFIEESKGRFRRKPVKTGRLLEDHVVLEDGVQPGDRIVTHGSLLLNAMAGNAPEKGV
jgi:membrane fusion protein, heavy metal efflux system